MLMPLTSWPPLAADVDDGLDGGIGHMDAHGVAGDFGNILIREGNLVAAVAGTDEVLEILAGRKLGNLVNDFLHRRDGALLGVDLALDCGVGNHLAVLIQDDCLGIGGTYVATAEILHFIYSLQNI